MRQYLTLLPLLLGGCSLNPPLDKPALPVASYYALADSAGGNAADLGWRTFFNDPALQQIIASALANNRDLRAATLKVEIVAAQYRIQRAERLPSLTASGSWSRKQTADNLLSGDSGTTSQHNLTLGLSAFEIDLFGRVRSLSEAAGERYLASEAAQRAVRITLIASLAQAWYNQMLAAEQLTLAEKVLADWQHALQLTYQRQAANQSSLIDVAQAQGQVASAEADVEENKRALLHSRNALGLLTGSTQALPAASATLEDARVRLELPAGLPSDLLTRRPDIIQAEHELVAANADIGAVRAALFPRLSLTASLGLASAALNNLFSSGSRSWQLMPQIDLPVFQGGRGRNELALARLKKSAALVNYEKAIQVAFREVSDGLAGNATYRLQRAAQQRVVASARQRLSLSSLRYQNGLDSRLELLDSQRQWYAAQQTLLRLRSAEIDNAITLYKALGGGIYE
ncbi:RND transporter [Erwinia sp. OLTSP20]|uniref:efflux transporter outer membrane subunit n=1 Tax=unclassified Erwinia TaxID=2622719 RepID=UPI000C19654C|nr:MULTISPECIES: efflux transporter outer membrane subunit [unclassified Erwinia]PIJ50951.1 RND transporter [Erwinia sp. OAMSP11]PIJ75921.1 RND transporter [Erwinia sp. OLSSP12]PIJ83633.1 RND transporter [Erwinia sp. OLCASP19]PIJ87489.1 RND transporter [Erwinia sp. OLMTSP26]PIJ89037.1 RND transporter [Erwinia sp. OLMDSP33]